MIIKHQTIYLSRKDKKHYKNILPQVAQQIHEMFQMEQGYCFEMSLKGIK